MAKFTMSGFETVEISETEIRNLSDGIQMLKRRLESHFYDGREDDLKVYDDLLEKLAKVAGYGKSIMETKG